MEGAHWKTETAVALGATTILSLRLRPSLSLDRMKAHNLCGKPHLMILTNVETVPGHSIVEHYGLVQGSTIRAKHFGRDIMASLKNLVGGELTGYTELLMEARAEATRRMVAQAEELGANAIVNVRFATSSVAQGAAELLAYGTAVRID